MHHEYQLDQGREESPGSISDRTATDTFSLLDGMNDRVRDLFGGRLEARIDAKQNTREERQLAKAVEEALQTSGVNLSHVLDVRPIEHMVEVADR